MSAALLLTIVSLLMAGAALAGVQAPPELINYQGVLRDAAGAPQDGTFNMTFRFFNAETAGDELLIDEHLASGAGGVTVTNGLFNVQLGSGTLADGSGPGTFSSLGDVFRREAVVHLEVVIEGETLSPRTRVVSAGYSIGDAPADPVCWDDTIRFVDCGNGTITDTATGVIWLKDANCWGDQPWSGANSLVADLADGQCGLTDNSSPGDWRLPTLAELTDLTSQAQTNGCLAPFAPNANGLGCWSAGDPFVNLLAAPYWSSETLATDPTRASLKNFSSGNTGSQDKNNGNPEVWAVRKGGVMR